MRTFAYRKALALIVLAMFAAPIAGMLASVAQAAPPSGPFQLELLLNGNCWGANSATQTVTSTGTSVTATLTDGAVYSAQCDSAGHARSGSSVTTSFSATPSTFGSKHQANEEWRWVQGGTSWSWISVTGTANCQVGRCL